MPVNDVSIHIEAEDRSRQAFRQAEQSLDSLEKQTRELQGATRATGVAMGLLGNEAQESAIGVTNLGRSIFRTSAEAKKFGGVFQDQRGRLREANGQYTKTNEVVTQLGRTFQRTGRRATELGSGFTRASGGANILTRSVGSLGGVLGALGIAAVTHEIGQFGIASVQAAGQMAQLRRATEQIQGSSAAAETRIAQLIQVANLPGLNFESLVRYANQFATLGLSAEDTDKILLGVGQTVVSLGGTAASAELSIIQLLQAFRAGTIDMRDFRTIIQQIPGVLNAAADVHGVEANIEGLREAFEATGGSMRDLLIPVFDELNRRFEAPPADSYIVAMDTLQNAFFLTQSAIGDLFLPAVTNAAIALSEFLEAARAGLKDIDALPEPIRDIVVGAKELYDGLLNIAESIGSSVGPEVRELLPALATLLGGVLELAGAIANVLEPAFQLWAHVQAVVFALVTKLAQDITSLIGVLTDFVDWVSSAWQAEERFAESTQRVTQAIEEVEKAATGASGSFQEYAGNLRVLLEELASVNSELEEKKARLKELEADGLTPADASMAQIARRIGLLEERSKSLTNSLPDLKQTLEDVNSQLADKEKRLAGMIEGNERGSASAQQLQRQIANLTTLAALLNTQIAITTTELTETAPATETAAQAVENYSLTLARLKAEAEDARDTLSNTINFEQLSANYQNAIAASDAYYNRQIANAQAALASAEADSDEYFKIETDLFNLRRDQVEARKKLSEAANTVARTEAERRIEIANEEKERLQRAGEETARALAASQKQQSQAAEAEQKRITEAHEANLKEREEAERASNARIVQNSQEQLSALSNAFENALPQSVDNAYENIQSATIQHYETLKNQARQRITDEDALNAELVSLDRQRNAALEENHRTYLTRIASYAKDLLGERTDAFKSASDDILHNWERTVSEFERRLREADTEDAIRTIESDFTTAQQQMLASLETVLTELGFTAEQAAEIMKEVYRTAEGEADAFADKVISAFKRLGKEADRETKRQNREIERNYRELVGEIEHILSNITDFFIDITRGGDIEDAFRQLGERVAESFLDVFTRDISQNLAASITHLASETDIAGASASRGGGAGGAIQAAGGLTSILSLITSPVALAAIIPAAVGAATYYVGRQIAGDTPTGPVNRQGRPIGDQTPSRRRGETRAAYENRLRARAEAQAAIAERETFFGNYDPRAPFGRAIQETGIFTGDSGYFAESALRQTGVDIFGRIDLPGLVEDLEGILQTRVEGLGDDMQRAASALESASGADLKPALDQYFTATTDFYQTQIDFANFVRRTTGNLSFGDVEGLSRQLQDALNQARLQDTSTNLTLFGIQRNRREAQAIAESSGTDRQYTEDLARLQYGEGTYDAEVAAASSVIDENQAREIATALERAKFNIDTGVEAFRNAAQIGAVTLEEIQSLWDEHVAPNLNQYYEATLSHANAIEDLDDQALFIDQNHLQSPEAFATHLKTQFLNPVMDAQRADDIADALNLAKFNLDMGVAAFRNAAQVGTVTVEQIQSLWDTNVIPNLDEYFAAALNSANQIQDPDDRSLFIQQNHLQSPEAFATHLEQEFLSPIIDAQKADDIADALASAKRSLDDGVLAFRNAAVVGTITVDQIQPLWETNVAPNINAYYQAALAHADTITDPDDRQEFIETNHLQSPDAFKTFLESQYLNPIIDAQKADDIGDALTRAKRHLDQGVLAFQNAAQVGAVTVAQIQGLWETHVEPNISEYFAAALAHADTIQDPDDRSEYLAQEHLQSPEAFETYLINEILNPVIDAQTADNIADGLTRAKRNLDDGVTAFQNAAVIGTVTTEQIRTLWQANVAPNIDVYYQAALAHADTIPDADDREEYLAQEHLQSPEAFRDYLVTTFLDPVIDQQLADNIADGLRRAKTHLDNGVMAFQNASQVGTVTIEQIQSLWDANVAPNISEYYTAAIAHADTITDPDDRADYLAQEFLQSPETFAAHLVSTYLDPVIDAQKADDIGDGLVRAKRNLDNGVTAFQNATVIGTVTIAQIEFLWNANVVPNVDTYYAAALAHANTIPDPDDRADYLAQEFLQSPEAFEAHLISTYLDPVIDAQKADDIADGVDNAKQNLDLGVEAFQNAASIPGTTLEGLQRLWDTHVVPNIDTYYQAALESADAIADPDERGRFIVGNQLQSPEDFLAHLESTIFDPISNNIRERTANTQRNLGQNRINRARFNLGGRITSEDDFEARRDALIAAINEYYDAEEERIDDLEGSEGELRDLREKNQQARRQALRQAESATNQHLGRIKDLRDQEVENEQNRLDAIADLNEDHQDRLTEIAEDGLRAREDLQRDFSRGIEDILRDAGVDESFFLHGDFQTLLRTAQAPSGEPFREQLDRLGIDLSEDDIGRVQDLALRRLRQQEDVGLRQARAESDLEQRTRDRETDIEAQADATALAIRDALSPLLEQQAETEETESPVETKRAITAAVEEGNAAKKADNLVIESENAMVNKTVAEMMELSVGAFGEGSSVLKEAAQDILDADVGRIADEVARIPDALDGFVGAVISLDETLQELPQILSGAILNAIGLLPTFLMDAAEAILSPQVRSAREANIIPEDYAPQATAETAAAIKELANPTEPIPVEVTNSDDIYDPQRIKELRTEGYNNREIGMLLREAAEPMIPDMSSIAAQTPITPEMAASAPSTQEMSISAGTVNVSGGSVNVSGGGGASSDQQINVSVNADVNLDGQKVGQLVGDSIRPLRSQGRSLI